jgi:ribose transport system permease protein
MKSNRLAWRLRESQPILTAIGVLLVIVIVSLSALPHFRSLGNLKNLLLQAVALGIVCIGQTFPIILAGIDLSVGAVINMSMCLTAGLSKGHGELLVPVVLLVLAIAMIIGFINGLVIAKTGVHPLIVTLGMMSIVQGALLLYTKVPVGPVPDSFYFVAWSEVLGIPFPFLLFCVIAVIAIFILRKTSFGRYIYATGGNEEVARLSGIPIMWIKIGAYMVCSVVAAMAGIFLSSRLGSPGPLAGENFMLDSITPVILGGTSLSGGTGGVGGTIAGVFIMTVLSNVLNIIGVQSYWQWVVSGIILIFALSISWKEKRR